MHIKMAPLLLVIGSSQLFMGSSQLWGQSSWTDDWAINTSISGGLGQYQNSIQRDTHGNTGASLQISYLERFRLDAAYQRTVVIYQTSGFDLTQNEYYLGGQFNLFSDTLGGTLGLAGHYIYSTNDDATGVTDNVNAYTATVSYLPWDKTWYLDAGAALSQYGKDFNVDQYTTAVGMAFNNQYDWLQIKGYAILPDITSSALASIQESYSADLTWTHWLGQTGWFKVDSLYLSGMVGERQLAVDAATFTLQNLADIKTQSYSAGINMRIDQSWLIGVTANYSVYRNEAINDNYNDGLLYFSLSKSW